jgi:predicted MFS family arabinose efflux permease
MGPAVHRRALLTAALLLYVIGHFALAIGVPLVSLLGAHIGWSATYLALSAASAAAMIVVFATVPGGLRTPPLSVAAWKAVFGNRKVQLLLAAATVALNTSLLYAGQAIGTSLGGWTLASGHADRSGLVAVTLIVIALFVSIAAERRFSA